MTERWQLVELIGQTLEERNITASEQTMEAVLDSIEDLIRADERDTATSVAAEMMNEAWATLRAEVEALKDQYAPFASYEEAVDDVLALFDGSSDE